MKWRDAIGRDAKLAAGMMGVLAAVAAAFMLGRKDEVKEAIKEIDTIIKNSETLSDRGIELLQLRVGMINAKMLARLLDATDEDLRGKEKGHAEWTEAIAEGNDRGATCIRQNAEIIELLRSIARRAGAYVEPEPELESGETKIEPDSGPAGER